MRLVRHVSLRMYLLFERYVSIFRVIQEIESSKRIDLATSCNIRYVMVIALHLAVHDSERVSQTL